MNQTLTQNWMASKKCIKIIKITFYIAKNKSWVYCEYLICRGSLKFRVVRADRPWGGWGWPAGSVDVRGPVCWGGTCCLRRARRTWGWCPSQQHSCGPNSTPFSEPEYRHLYCSRLGHRTPQGPGKLLEITTTISRDTWMSEHVYYLPCHILTVHLSIWTQDRKVSWSNTHRSPLGTRRSPYLQRCSPELD